MYFRHRRKCRHETPHEFVGERRRADLVDVHREGGDHHQHDQGGDGHHRDVHREREGEAGELAEHQRAQQGLGREQPEPRAERHLAEVDPQEEQGAGAQESPGKS